MSSVVLPGLLLVGAALFMYCLGTTGLRMLGLAPQQNRNRSDSASTAATDVKRDRDLSSGTSLDTGDSDIEEGPENEQGTFDDEFEIITLQL